MSDQTLMEKTLQRPYYGKHLRSEKQTVPSLHGFLGENLAFVREESIVVGTLLGATFSEGAGITLYFEGTKRVELGFEDFVMVRGVYIEDEIMEDSDISPESTLNILSALGKDILLKLNDSGTAFGYPIFAHYTDFPSETPSLTVYFKGDFWVKMSATQ